MMKSQAPELAKFGAQALLCSGSVRQYIENPQHSAWHLENVKSIVATSLIFFV